MSKRYPAVLALAVFSACAAAQPFPVNKQGDVRWVCTAPGPICLIQVPAGRYQLDASFKNEKLSASATVAKEVKQPAMVVFRFPEAN